MSSPLRFPQILLLSFFVTTSFPRKEVHASGFAEDSSPFVAAKRQLRGGNLGNPPSADDVTALTGSFADMRSPTVTGGRPAWSGTRSSHADGDDMPVSRQTSEDFAVPVGDALQGHASVLKRVRSKQRLTPVDYSPADRPIIDLLASLGREFCHPRADEIAVGRRLCELHRSIDLPNVNAGKQLIFLGIYGFSVLHLDAALFLQNSALNTPQFRCHELSVVYGAMIIFGGDFSLNHAKAMMKLYPRVNNMTVEDWLALIERDRSSFEEEVRNRSNYREPDKSEAIKMLTARTIKERVATAIALNELALTFEDNFDAATWYFVAYDSRDFSREDLSAIQGVLRFPSRAGFGASVVRHVVERSRAERLGRASVGF